MVVNHKLALPGQPTRDLSYHGPPQFGERTSAGPRCMKSSVLSRDLVALDLPKSRAP